MNIVLGSLKIFIIKLELEFRTCYRVTKTYEVEKGIEGSAELGPKKNI